MNIEYQSDGGEWVTALNYEISDADGGTVDISPKGRIFLCLYGKHIAIKMGNIWNQFLLY